MQNTVCYNCLGLHIADLLRLAQQHHGVFIKNQAGLIQSYSKIKDMTVVQYM